MKLHPRPRTKAEEVPAPSKARFEGFLKQLTSVSKEELERREQAWKKRRKK